MADTIKRTGWKKLEFGRNCPWCYSCYQKNDVSAGWWKKNSIKMARERRQPIYRKGRASIILFVLKRLWSIALQCIQLWPSAAGWKNGWCWCWFVVREKYCYFTETVYLISQASGVFIFEIRFHEELDIGPDDCNSARGPFARASILVLLSGEIVGNQISLNPLWFFICKSLALYVTT